MTDLFDDEPVPVMDGISLWRGYADPRVFAPLVDSIVAVSPWRQMVTPRGRPMSVSTSNCGEVGWIADRQGYRYVDRDPVTGNAWPPMPALFTRLATSVAAQSGFADFRPDACLINRYVPGTQMGAHQDRDEQDFAAPIVSVSLGIPARFFIVGATRTGRATSVDLASGDVIVMGGAARRHFHGVRKLKPASDEVLGDQRVNLTFRKAQ